MLSTTQVTVLMGVFELLRLKSQDVIGFTEGVGKVDSMLRASKSCYLKREKNETMTKRQ